MRRLFATLFALSSLGALAGCHHAYTGGLCDCDIDDHCCTRAPWVSHGHAPVPAAAPPAEHAPPPAHALPPGPPARL